MNLINKYLITEKNDKGDKWSGKVKLKWHAPEGLFKTGSAQEIADTVSKGVDFQTAMSRLTFYINRAGTNISSDQKKRVQNAMDILRKKR